MKKLFGILFLIFCTLPASAMMVSGTIVDESGDPLPGVTVIPTGGKFDQKIGTVTDADGNFEIKNFPDELNVSFSYIGKSPQILSPKKNMKLTMKDESTKIDSVVVEPTCDAVDGVKDAKYVLAAKKCVPTECDTPRYVLTGSGNNAKCEDQVGKTCDKGKGIKKAVYRMLPGALDSTKEELVCERTCNTPEYILDESADDMKCVPNEGNCKADDAAKFEHATKTGLVKGVCKVSECETGYRIKGGKCVEEKEKKEKKDKKETKNETNKTDAAAGSTQRGANNTSNKKLPEPTLSKEDSEKRISELKDNADAMKDKEQSAANKAIGAAGMAATGLGAMQFASATAAQNADQEAEADMADYIATFTCGYGDNHAHSHGGDAGVVVPGDDENFSAMRKSYITLADNLKKTKTSLGLTAGIESEEIIDTASSGLYDADNIGVITGDASGGGNLPSVYRALTDKNSDDAAAWAKQKSDTKTQKTTGIAMAGIGAVGSLAANLAVNKNAPKENSKQINRKYDKLRKHAEKVESEVAALPSPDADTKCPNGASGTHPDCKCTGNNIYNANNNTCDACPGQKVAVDDACQCPDGKVPGDNDTCIDEPTNAPKCNFPSSPYIFVSRATNKCACLKEWQLSADGLSCVCPSDTHTIAENGACNAKPAATPAPAAPAETTAKEEPAPTPEEPAELINITLTSDTLFKSGSYVLSDAAKQKISEFVTNSAAELKDNELDSNDICINISGHTDKSGGDAVNIPLSAKRANAVREYMTSIGTDPKFITDGNTKSSGRGSADCASGKAHDATCRAVKIVATTGSCSI